MKHYLIPLITMLACSTAQAATMTSDIYLTDNKHTKLGTVVFTDTPKGLEITTSLSGLPAGQHGFHLHQHGSCGNKGMDAGGHYDPDNTNSHQGPMGKGHLGDLPVLTVNADGTASETLLAPRLKTSELKGLSVMIHANGDNYSDNPPLGGGGARIACGTISEKK
jgi:Cu-Zn family superoxide dismutase